MVRKLKESINDPDKVTLRKLLNIMSSTTKVTCLDLNNDEYICEDVYLDDVVRNYPDLADTPITYLSTPGTHRLNAEFVL